ncbi:MAG: hypothetical protein M1832_002054 [Thelocarpon impressellum]|nr:MAG: hypothetical protein M1832_002054 [Thelocarpon impressellum]
MDNLGMLVLWKGEVPIEADVVFVHGLRGDRLDTWAKNRIVWPRDLLPSKIPHVRIMTWGYDANVMTFFPGDGPSSQSSIFQHAKGLLEDLQDERVEQDEKARPIIFVAHSLGGLVVKDALCMANNEHFRQHNRRGAAIGASTVGIIFAGTPHRGSNRAAWASVATKVARHALNDRNDKVVKALNRGSATLERIQHGFSPILTRLRIFSLLEDHTYSMIGKIVDDDSATLGAANERQRTIPADHVGMVRFDDVGNVGFKRTVGALSEIIESCSNGRKDTESSVARASQGFSKQTRMGAYQQDGPTAQQGSGENEAPSVSKADQNLPSALEPAGSGKVQDKPIAPVPIDPKPDRDQLLVLGRWKKAEELDVQDLEKCKSVLGLEHPETLNCIGNLASIYKKQGRWKEAEEPELQIMEIRKQVLGLGHHDTLNSIANLALTYKSQGRWKEAEELLVQVMETVTTSGLLDSENRTLLGWAAAEGHEAIVRLLVDRDDVEADAKDQDGRTPLWWAAWGGHEGIVRLLVDRDDVEADSKDQYGQTPLSRAAEEGHEAVVKLLVDRDDVEADANDLDGRTPLSLAALRGHEAVVMLLVDRDDVEADAKDKHGRTPLWMAALRGHEAVVKLLVDRDDVEADSKDKHGGTPLSRAAARGHEAVVKLLVDRDDVEADSKDQWGKTPLWRAAAEGHEAVVKLLVDRDDVEADSKDQYGQTPLWRAAERGHEAVVKLLVDRDDVEADSKDQYGETPLWRAAERGHEAVVRLLVDRDDVEADSKD